MVDDNFVYKSLECGKLVDERFIYKEGDFVCDNYNRSNVYDLTNPNEIIPLLNNLWTLVVRQSNAINDLVDAVHDIQLKEDPFIRLTQEDLKTLNDALGYYSHGRCWE